MFDNDDDNNNKKNKIDEGPNGLKER